MTGAYSFLSVKNSQLYHKDAFMGILFSELQAADPQLRSLLLSSSAEARARPGCDEPQSWWAGQMQTRRKSPVLSREPDFLGAVGGQWWLCGIVAPTHRGHLSPPFPSSFLLRTQFLNYTSKDSRSRNQGRGGGGKASGQAGVCTPTTQAASGVARGGS